MSSTWIEAIDCDSKGCGFKSHSSPLDTNGIGMMKMVNMLDLDSNDYVS